MARRDRFQHIADRLDRLARVSTATLAASVIDGGACIEAMTSGDPPELTGDPTVDRETAAALCSGCPLQEECLELELRWSGECSAGVFGTLPAADRRALFPIWRARRGGEQR